jgi:hypothetical protein
MDITSAVQQKKWSKKDKKRALAMLHRGEKKKTRSSKVMYQLNYWLILFVLLCAQVLFAITLLPFLIIAEYLYVSFLVLLLGAGLGALASHIVSNIEKPIAGYMLCLGVFMTLSSFFTLYLATTVSNQLAILLGFVQAIQQPIIVGILYALAFSAFYGLGSQKQVA